MMMKMNFPRVAAVLLLTVAVALPQAAQERNVKLSLFYSQAEMQGENELGDVVLSQVLDFQDADGYGASANFMVGPFFSVEAALFNLRTDTALVLDDTMSIDFGTLSLTPVTLGGQFHILGDRRIDPYVGGGIAYVIGDDLLSPETETAGLGRIEVEDAVTYYLNAGVALQLTQGFGIVVDARQIQYEPSSRSTATGVERDLELTPRIYSAGVRLRF